MCYCMVGAACGDDGMFGGKVVQKKDKVLVGKPLVLSTSVDPHAIKKHRVVCKKEEEEKKKTVYYLLLYSYFIDSYTAIAHRI